MKKSIYTLFIATCLNFASTKPVPHMEPMSPCTEPNKPCALKYVCDKGEPCEKAIVQGYCNQRNRCIVLNRRCSPNPLNAVAPNGRYTLTPQGTVVCAVEGRSCSTDPLDASAPKGKYEMTPDGLVCSSER